MKTLFLPLLVCLVLAPGLASGQAPVNQQRELLALSALTLRLSAHLGAWEAAGCAPDLAVYIRPDDYAAFRASAAQQGIVLPASPDVERLRAAIVRVALLLREEARRRIEAGQDAVRLQFFPEEAQ